MTRCECAGVTFVEVAYRMQYEGQTLPEVMDRTGCGQTCTACMPDLRSFLREKGLL
jgi:bacterioferritin-associated ferredoxin